MSTRASDKLFAALKSSKDAGEAFQVMGAALLADPLLATGLVVILALIYLFGRIYLWPQINPCQIQWISNLWDWATSPRPPTPQERYPYAKVIYPTYR
jgi:hypothetical protein